MLHIHALANDSFGPHYILLTWGLHGSSFVKPLKVLLITVFLYVRVCSNAQKLSCHKMSAVVLIH